MINKKIESFAVFVSVVVLIYCIRSYTNVIPVLAINQISTPSTDYLESVW